MFTSHQRRQHLKDLLAEDDFAQPPGVKGGNSSTPLCSLVEYVERYFVSGWIGPLHGKLTDSCPDKHRSALGRGRTDYDRHQGWEA